MAYLQILEKAGSCLMYQYRSVIILSLQWFLSGFLLFSFIYLFACPKFLCQMNQLRESDTNEHISYASNYKICQESVEACSEKTILQDITVNFQSTHEISPTLI